MLYTNHYESPLGSILLAGDDEGLTGLWFTEGTRYVGLGLKREAIPHETEYFEQAKKWLDTYFTGRDPGFLPKSICPGQNSEDTSGKLCVKSPSAKPSLMDGSPKRSQENADTSCFTLSRSRPSAPAQRTSDRK